MLMLLKHPINTILDINDREILYSGAN